LALLLAGALVVAVAPALSKRADPPDRDSLEGVLAAARADHYWALDLMEDGEASWEDLETAHQAWQDCIDQTGLGLVTAAPRKSPADGYFEGYWLDADPGRDQSDLSAADWEKVDACRAAFDLEYLQEAYAHTHPAVMAPDLREYVVKCVAGPEAELDPDSVNAQQLAADLGVDPESYLLWTCVAEGENELYPYPPEDAPG
jgi:hypothetical protein